MKIINLQAENVKRLSAVEIKPDGSLVIVGGKNGAGKSSVLDAITYALSGAKSLPRRPVRDGEQKGSVVIDLAEHDGKKLRVEWSMSPDKRPIVKVLNEDGSKFSSPQSMLDAMFGALTFDPVAFEKMKPQDQVNTLKRVTGVEQEFEALTTKRQWIYEQRTDVNRDVKNYSSQMQGIDVPEDAPTEPVDVNDLIVKRQKMDAIRSENQKRREALAELGSEGRDCKSRLATIDESIAELEQQLEAQKKKRVEVNKQLEDYRKRYEATKKQVEALEDPDTEDIDNQISEASEINRTVDLVMRYNELKKSHDAAQKTSDTLSKELAGIDKQKHELLANAELPIDGMEIGEDGVLYNGVPFDQCSSAERLRVSVAMGMAMNTELRVMLIRDGSLLDEDNLSIISDVAAKNDYQIWIERVGEGDECTVIIEDGHIK